MNNYGQFNPENLLNAYQPLIKATYKKYNTYFHRQQDKAELFNQIEFEFAKLVQEYNPRRGVDFPCYIKRMLSLRVYHYVNKTIGVRNREVDCEEVYDVMTDSGFEDASLEFVEGLASVNKDMVLGKKQRQLMLDVLIKKKTLEAIASEEGVDIKVIRLRLHFLCKKLRVDCKSMEEYFTWKNGGIPTDMVDYDSGVEG